MSGLVLAVMVVPIIATTHDLLRQVPVLPREGAIAWGCQVGVCRGHPAVGVQRHRRAVVLGLGRALGDDGGSHGVRHDAGSHARRNIYATMTTIAAPSCRSWIRREPIPPTSR